MEKIQMEKDLKHISKFMSLVLRHKPEEIGIQLDANGWANIDDLIKGLISKGYNVDLKIIRQVVETNDKKRFVINSDSSMIRANQGHSIEVELNLLEIIPPDVLYHGTSERNLDKILTEGLTKQSRQHVHLSLTIDVARSVGSRHGKPIVLTIRAKEMYDAGFKFYLSENKVWLTDIVPVEYIINLLNI